MLKFNFLSNMIIPGFQHPTEEGFWNIVEEENAGNKQNVVISIWGWNNHFE